MLVLAVFVFASCEDEELAPILTFDTATIGAYPRLVELTTGEYDLANISTSSLIYEVDFVDESLGGEVVEYIIEGQFIDNTPGSDVSRPNMVFATFTPGDFSTSRNGNQGITITIPLSEALAFYGLSEDEVNAGDQFAFSTTVVHSDGTPYSATNSSNTVRGAAFQGFFTFNGTLTCPLDDADFAGDYALSYIGDATGGFGIPFPEGTVTINTIPGSSTMRSFNLPWAPGIGGFGVPDFTFDFVCENVIVADFGTGLACAGGDITIVQGEPSPFDLTNDTEIILNIIEYQTDGGCGVPPTPKTIRLIRE